MVSECFQLNALTLDHCDLKIKVLYFTFNCSIMGPLMQSSQIASNSWYCLVVLFWKAF